MKRSGLLVLVASLSLAAAPQKDAGKTDLDLVQGTWNDAGLEGSGAVRMGEFTDGLKIIIKGNRMTFQGPASNEELTFKLDPAKKPKEIDLTPPDAKQGTFQGIYALEGDRLKICYGRKEKD